MRPLNTTNQATPANTSDQPALYSRRHFIKSSGGMVAAALGLSLMPPSIQRALAIPANRRTGTLQDVEHIVILTQENRSFDHYFGGLRGVRGFGDRFPIPIPDSEGLNGKNVWMQRQLGNTNIPAQVIAPFHLNTAQNFAYMRVEGTPHSWDNAKYAYRDGIMDQWPTFKENHSMAYFKEEDLSFQYALANAFTLCDAYHCSFQGGTNPNRVYIWCGANDPLQQGKGPVINNLYDNVDQDPQGGYTFRTYTEELEQAGVSWKIYQDMEDNFTDNPVAGFRTFRASYFDEPEANPALAHKGLSTWTLDDLRNDVLSGQLPQVSYIVATAEGSEHPGPSSPAQGAEYTAWVLDALTANPDVWSKTVLLINFDENDGFFDHMPPPTVPSLLDRNGGNVPSNLAGASTVDTTGEYHNYSSNTSAEREDLLHTPYGLGPRVPMYVISPWSRGGWVNSQVFDHTSIIRFIEQRFGVPAPNITPWRRAVCGDLTSCFNFATPDDNDLPDVPDCTEWAARARALPEHTTPPTPVLIELPTQEYGIRPSRALPYELHVSARADGINSKVELVFANSGGVAAVFQVYDRLQLNAIPRRYTVEAGKQLTGTWEVSDQAGRYDLWVLAPNGFHRHFTGDTSQLVRDMPQAVPEIQVCYAPATGNIHLRLHNDGQRSCPFELKANAYYSSFRQVAEVAPQSHTEILLDLAGSAAWYDFSVVSPAFPGYSRRFAGRVETGKNSVSDPVMGGMARVDQ